MMIYISRIKIRGFKSFKSIDIILPKDFVCLAGPNGSGKSNICDAIRFACGEKSLKGLRTKKVKDLISHNLKMAEVAIYLDGDEKHEIRRAIREDGKIMYRLDGNRSTRTSILNLLKKFNIDESGRNTIAQGETQRIITMTAKERRGIIDSIAGISEFEDKKKEAMKNLEVVETRLREGSIILGEKLGMLGELEKEKEFAIKYLENKKIFSNAKGSLIKKEMERLSPELEKAILDAQKISNSIKAKQADLTELDGKIKIYEQEKTSFLNEIELRQHKSELSKKMEAVRFAIAINEQELEEKKRAISNISPEIIALAEELKKDKEELKKTEENLKNVETECNTLKARVGTYAPAKIVSLTSAAKLEEKKTELARSRERAIKIEGEINVSEQLANEKESTLNISISDNRIQQEKLREEIAALKKEIAEAKAELDSLFENEREMQGKIAEMEKHLLSLRERTAELRSQNPRLVSNAAMNFINQTNVREKGSGINGALIDLVKFDAKYANAIEAAVGARLLYIVVDCANTATKLIAKIKENGRVRITFIPLKEIKSVKIEASEGLGLLMDYVKFDSEVEKAVQYAFGETILISNMDEAKKIGIGKYRMVTLDGELFEKSGVITGGRMQTGITANAALSKLESEIAEIKNARESMLGEVCSLREQMSSVRSICAEKEVHLKSCEIQLSAFANEDERAKKEIECANIKKTEVDELRVKVQRLVLDKTALEKEITILTEEIARDEQSVAVEREHLMKRDEESNKKYVEITAKISSLETKREALFNEIAIRKTNLRKSELNLEQRCNEKNACVSRISELERNLLNEKNELMKQEKEITSSNKELESIFKKMKESEEKIIEFGKQRGQILFEIEKMNKEINGLAIKKATNETRLADLTAEFYSFKEFEFLDISKDELVEMAKNADSFLSTNQNVNLTSIELCEKKSSEIRDTQEKMKTLKEEKEAIIKMIEELDVRKKEAFFNTFYAVSDNFRKIFRHIPQIGECYLYLDKPNDPFGSGLYLKIKRGTRELGIESLSGGENTLIALMFIFALQFVKPSPYYVLDEADSALDKENSKNFAKLIREMSKDSQFILVSHNDTVVISASVVFGVSKSDGISKVVGIKFEN